MSLELHPKARERLVELLQTVLRDVHVQGNSFLHWPSLKGVATLDHVVPGHSELQRQLAEFIGDEPVSDFVIGRLSDSLSIRPYDSEQPTCALSDIPEFRDLSTAAHALVVEFERLPVEYTAFARVPWELSRELVRTLVDLSLPLSNTLRLIRLGDTHPEFARAPASTPYSFFDDGPKGVDSDALYLSEDLYGYIPTFGESAPLLRFAFNVRAFFGLTFALRLAKPGSISFFGPAKEHILIYRRNHGDVEYHRPHEHPPDVSDCIRAVGLGDAYKTLPEDARPLLMKAEVDLVATAFSEPRNAGVLRAAQWLFDSYSSRSQLLAFVQATVALEILFGDKAISDVVGLGELLGNRVAYLIGTTRQQREEVLKDFRRIYETRSRIVHRGHNLLSAQERSDLYTLRWMCSRAILRELELAKADAD